MGNLRSEEDTRKKAAARHAQLLKFVCLFKRITFTFIEKWIINRFNFLKGNLAIYEKTSKHDKVWKVYVCVEMRRKRSKMFMWLSLAAKFIGAFYFLLNIFQI